MDQPHMSAEKHSFIKPAFLSRFPLCRDPSGSVGIIFGLALLPILLLVGGAIDYSKATGIKSKAQGAVDAAALAGAAAAGAKLQAGDNVANATSAGDAAAQMTFNAYVGSWRGASVSSFAPGANVTQANVQYSSSATLQVPTPFLRLAGLPTLPVHANSTAKVSAGKKYIDIYVLVDASQSMAIGATAADQTGMKAAAPAGIGCMLACHNGSSVDATKTSSVVTARSKGFKLRFDVVRDALNSIVTQAATNMALTGATIRFGVYSFATNFKTEIDITSNYGSATTPNTIIYAVKNMDVADLHAGTSLQYALNQLSPKIIPAPGNGSSAASPQVFVLLMTDGVGNAADNIPVPPATDWLKSPNFSSSTSTACWTATPAKDGTARFPPTGTPINPPCLPDPRIACSASKPCSPPTPALPYYHKGSPEMVLDSVNPAWCQPIKTLGAAFMTLYTTYIPATDSAGLLDSKDWRTAYISQKLVGSIPGNLRSCASSPADYFVANDPAQITTAANAMFAKITKITSAKLTQ
jgi:Flp pilus assembly protein TadG